MCVGYDPSHREPEPFADLDEFLCEYVDGEMDPTVKTVFEEYIGTDPALAEHVECLRRTRAMLCAYSCRVDAPCGLHARLHSRLKQELNQVPWLITSTASPRTVFTGFASVVAVLFMAGIFMSGANPAGLTESPGVATVSSITGDRPEGRAMRPPTPGVPVPHRRFTLGGNLREQLRMGRSMEGVYAPASMAADSHVTVYASAQSGLQTIGLTP
jgi:hypothetical protein